MLQRKKIKQALQIEAYPRRLSFCSEYSNFVQLDFAHADLRFGKEPQSATKTEPDVDEGPFAAFNKEKTASAMQKFIVPWNITLHCLSYVKKMTDKDIKAQLIAVINSENLMP